MRTPPEVTGKAAAEDGHAKSSTRQTSVVGGIEEKLQRPKSSTCTGRWGAARKTTAKPARLLAARFWTHDGKKASCHIPHDAYARRAAPDRGCGDRRQRSPTFRLTKREERRINGSKRQCARGARHSERCKAQREERRVNGSKRLPSLARCPACPGLTLSFLKQLAKTAC